MELYSSLDARLDAVEECACCCEGVLEPVCGCDGLTYANECEALRAGTQIDHERACPGRWPDRCTGDASAHLHPVAQGGG
jgi:hypothetical protein